MRDKVYKSVMVALVIAALALLGLLAWQGTAQEAEPVQIEAQSVGGTPIANWGGGEQLVYGLPWSILGATPTPIPLLADHHAGALVNISWEHYQVHEANTFRVDTTDPDLDTDELLSICFRTPVTSTAEIHIVGIGAATGQALFEYWENPEITGGTEITPVNRYRIDPVTSTLRSVAGNANRVTIGAAITTTNATLLQRFLGGSTTNRFTIPTQATDLEEFELTYDTLYCGFIKAQADDIVATFTAQWYELDRSSGWPVK